MTFDQILTTLMNIDGFDQVSVDFDQVMVGFCSNNGIFPTKKTVLSCSKDGTFLLK